MLADTLLLVGVLTPKSEMYDSKSRRMYRGSKFFAMSSSENVKYGISMFGRDFPGRIFGWTGKLVFEGQGSPLLMRMSNRRAATNGSILRREFPNI